MQITIPSIDKTCPEVEVFESMLNLDNQTILELGCGDATLTRLIASGGHNRKIIATEVDQIQHDKNLLLEGFTNIQFKLAGSQKIPVSDNTIDTAFMFKSLHHVPLKMMDRAMLEVKRVLKPGGKAYISEPVFDGDFNDILRIFHDEEMVRFAAFETIKNAVDQDIFNLKKELFFKVPLAFENFSQFTDKVIGVTHSQHQLSVDTMEKVKWKFKRIYNINQGLFLTPIRVDILEKP